MISASVPHRPTATPSTSTDPSCRGGSGMSSRARESAVPGRTVSARTTATVTPAAVQRPVQRALRGLQRPLQRPVQPGVQGRFPGFEAAFSPERQADVEDDTTMTIERTTTRTRDERMEPEGPTAALVAEAERYTFGSAA